VQKQREARQAYSKRPTWFQERKGFQGSKEKEAIAMPTASKESSPIRGTRTPEIVERSRSGSGSSHSQSTEMEAEATSAQILVPCTQFSFTTPSQVQSTKVQSAQVESN
jgi:hypothetical protein